MIADLLKIIADLLPMIHPDQAAKVQAKIDALEKAHKENYAKLLKALDSGDIGAVNLLISELLGEL